MARNFYTPAPIRQFLHGQNGASRILLICPAVGLIRSHHYSADAKQQLDQRLFLIVSIAQDLSHDPHRIVAVDANVGKAIAAQARARNVVKLANS